MMEAKCLSKAKTVSLDRITKLPQPVIETILCLLPIQEAARTSILSREWRYKWTTIPKLVFDMSVVYKCRIKDKRMISWCKHDYPIHQVLLLHQGPIHEFTLSMSIRPILLVDFEIDQIIFYLSRNHAIKKLTLKLDSAWYKLPSCAYSLHQLTDLYLESIDLDHQPIISGFGSLRSLCLNNVNISPKALLHLLSSCPSLTSFSLLLTDSIVGHNDCTILELFECLPLIEHLTTIGWCVLPMLVLNPFPKELPTSLIHLKYFCFKEMWFVNYGLPFLVGLIKFSPNLEKIILEISVDYYYEDDKLCSSILEEYSDVWLEHLTELEIENFHNLKPEMDFVKFILARSPKLKKVSLISVVEKGEHLSEMLKILLRAPRASPVEIVVE